MTRSQDYPYSTGHGVKKLVNRTFSTARPQSCEIFSSNNLFLKVMNFSLNYLKQKKIFEAFISPKFVISDRKYVPYKIHLSFVLIF